MNLYLSPSTASSKKTRAGKQNGTSSRNPKDADEDDEEDVDSPDDDDQDEDVDELSPSEDETEEDDDDDDFRAPTRSAAAGKKRKSAPGAAKGASQKKKVKGSSPAAGRKGSGQPRKPRARKTKAANGDDLDEVDGATKKATSAKDFPIEDDNELFSELLVFILPGPYDDTDGPNFRRCGQIPKHGSANDGRRLDRIVQGGLWPCHGRTRQLCPQGAPHSSSNVRDLTELTAP